MLVEDLSNLWDTDDLWNILIQLQDVNKDFPKRSSIVFIIVSTSFSAYNYDLFLEF